MKVSMGLTISYVRGKPSVAYLTLPQPIKARVHRTRQFEGEILVDFSRTGEALGIEMLDPEKTTLTRLNRIMKKLKLPPLSRETIEPLRRQ